MLTGSSIGTFIPRIDLFALLSNMQIPEWGIDWLKHEQVALMAALIAYRTGLFTLGEWVGFGRIFLQLSWLPFLREDDWLRL
ncbi:AzlD domain-containing protein [Peribacillus frigoritolerans]|uniref:AzlD domain-containing protein n=2 Tax=Peribacillus frigoritolerans TaxID=450367 RepID=UPI0011456DFF|nr:AzlD domain-containing protein [Peribacillus frigoritolerans]MBD8135568.1 AzlD domain-containing protein [Bacillus sp. CFBP 13597]MCK2018152.1 AzlD domain-containing protein [Peribacillus frigoritolerans]